jgi:hypothetical protein
MRKYLILLLFFLFSCEKDFIDEGGISIPREDRIFAVTQSSVVDNQRIFFNIESNGDHTLAIKDLETNSILSKETFTATLGLNDRVLYTKSLPKKKLQLILYQDSTELKKTSIIVN